MKLDKNHIMVYLDMINRLMCSWTLQGEMCMVEQAPLFFVLKAEDRTKEISDAGMDYASVKWLGRLSINVRKLSHKFPDLPLNEEELDFQYYLEYQDQIWEKISFIVPTYWSSFVCYLNRYGVVSRGVKLVSHICTNLEKWTIGRGICHNF